MKAITSILTLLAVPLCLSAQLQKVQALGQDDVNQYVYKLSTQIVYFQYSSSNSSSSFRSSIWITDATSGGATKIVSDVSILSPGVLKGDTLFFIMWDSQNNINLMRYSTPGGLTKLTSLSYSSTVNGTVVIRGLSSLTICDDILYFVIYDGTKNWVWKSDGSVNGTAVMPFDFNSSIYNGINLASSPNGDLIITVEPSPNVSVKWNYNTATQDTTYLHNYIVIPEDHAVLNGIYYFSNFDAQHGYELWRSDGTEAGTYLLTDIDPRTYYDSYNQETIPFHAYPHQFFVFNGKVYFTIWRNSQSPYDNSVAELWKTDGIAGFVDQVQSSLYEWSSFNNFSVFPNFFVFTYNDEVHGNEWWISDGSPAGTKLLQDLQAGPANSLHYSDSFLSTNSSIYFSATDGKIGNELWQFDGLTKSVNRLVDVLPGANSSHPTAIQKLGNSLLFMAKDETGETYLFRLDLSAVQVIAPDDTPLLPATQWFQTLGHEIFLSGFQSNAYYNYDMGIDGQNNIYLTGQFNNDRMIYYENSAIIRLPATVRNANQVSKFGPDGLLKWQRVLHTDNAFTEFYNGPMLSVMPDNGVVVACSFGSSGLSPWVNYMGLPQLTFSGLYVTRLRDDGTILWAKYLLDASYQPYVHSVKVDADGNIYVAGLYYDGLYWEDQLLLHYRYTPTYFLLKFNQNGNLIWANDVATEWSNYGKIADLKIDNEKQRIYLLITEGTRNESSSCEFQKWHFTLIESDLDGNFVRSKEVESSDFMVATSFDYNSVHDYYVVGYFRGTISSDEHHATTLRVGDCSATRSFLVQLDSSWKTVAVKTDENDPSDPYELQFLPSGNYVISGTNGKEIFINQYDPLNTLLGKKIFRKDLEFSSSSVVDFTYFNPIVRFDHAGNFILSDRYLTSVDSVANSIQGQTLKTFILKAPLSEVKPIPFAQSNQFPIDVYPNPVKDRLNIKIHEQNTRKFGVRLIDALGRLVGTPELNYTNEIYYMDTTPYSNGLYFLVFNNGSQRITRKIIIDN